MMGLTMKSQLIRQNQGPAIGNINRRMQRTILICVKDNYKKKKKKKKKFENIDVDMRKD
jgi:hypothetical protein